MTADYGIADVDYDRREREGEAREADESARWMCRVGERLHRGLPVSDQDRAIYENNIAARGWSS